MILISVTQKGNKIGERLKKSIPTLQIITREELVSKGLQSITQMAMQNYSTVIFVSSTGIAVRAIAPWVRDKRSDPAVIVIDAQARYVISLLSGHLGGANKATQYIAKHLDAQPIITTATEGLGIVAPDMISQEYGLAIESMKKCKEISVHLIEGKKVSFTDEEGVIPLPSGYVEKSRESQYHVVVSNKAYGSGADLQLIRKNIVLGIGCKKSISSKKMKHYILDELHNLNIHPLAVERIVTIDIKKEEPCIIELAQYLNVPIDIYRKEEINGITEAFQGSDFVEKSIGVRGVCEPCVILSGAQILKGKTKQDGMTLCVGIRKKEKADG